MKLCTFKPAGAADGRLCAASSLGDGLLVELLPATQQTPPSRSCDPRWLQSMQAYLGGGDAATEAAASVLQQADRELGRWHLKATDGTFLAPLPRPSSIRDAMVFEQHFLQARRGGARLKLPLVAGLDRWSRRLVGRGIIGVPKRYRELPVYYKGNPASVVGPEAEIGWPGYSDRLDYELEIGLFINRPGTNLSPDQALRHIGGYTIFNDFSARDAQLAEMELGLGPAKGKDFDTGNAMGPWLVSPDEVGDPMDLDTEARVNGQVWTRSSTRDSRWSVGELLSHISASETLWPGDFIGLGTVPGGCGLEHGRWLRRGDRIELEVSRLGTLCNRVAATRPGRAVVTPP